MAKPTKPTKPTIVNRVCPDCAKCVHFGKDERTDLILCQRPGFQVPHPNCNIWRVPCVYYIEKR